MDVIGRGLNVENDDGRIKPSARKPTSTGQVEKGLVRTAEELD
jgi:hypothetical protein